MVHFKASLISMDKVYGDFKKLHYHIRETFETEIKEWERYLESGESEIEISSLAEQSDHPILLSKRVAEEIGKFGRHYHEEATRILRDMPELPSKFEDEEGSRVSPDELMVELRNYLNAILQFSPLISNLFYLRDFLTKGESQVLQQQQEQKPAFTMTSLNETQEYNENDGFPNMDMYDKDRTDSFQRAFDQFTGTGDEQMVMMGLPESYGKKVKADEPEDDETFQFN